MGIVKLLYVHDVFKCFDSNLKMLQTILFAIDYRSVSKISENRDRSGGSESSITTHVFSPCPKLEHYA